jgi:transposase
MARAREFYAGEGKTDPKDAFVLADVARAHPQRVAWLEPTPEARAQLGLLCGYDEDLRADINRVTNRLRMLLLTYSPDLERAFGQRLAKPTSLGLLERYPSREALLRAGQPAVATWLAHLGARDAEVFALHLVTASGAQTVTIAGAAQAEQIVRELAVQLRRLVERREELEGEIAEAFFRHPEAAIVTSMPGFGARLGARVLVDIGDIGRFPSSAHLASYSGLGPTPWRSGTSLRGDVASHFGNHRLKNAFFLAAFASLRHPPSRAYYDRKRAEGKKHNQALLCLARRRLDVLYALLTHGACYQPPSTRELPRAA